MKRHLLQFLKNLIYTKGIIWRDTIHNSTIPQIPIYTKGVSWRDTFYNSKKLDLYYRCLLKRHFPQFLKIQYVLKIGKMILKRKMSIFNINLKFSIVYENCGKCLLKRHFQYKPNFLKIVKGVSIPKKWHYTEGVS